VPIKDWTVVYEGERLQADIIGAALEAEGFEVQVFGDNAYGVAIDLTAARVLVPTGQASEARRVIVEAESRPLDLTEDEPEPEDV
jgi:putative signal transducing protein